MAWSNEYFFEFSKLLIQLKDVLNTTHQKFLSDSAKRMEHLALAVKHNHTLKMDIVDKEEQRKHAEIVLATVRTRKY